mmetsp:Transcript_24132/g.61417  ORF Transcript_24132/g.61417 Transcript_24132/m.61417 type:complete len:302 (-) Transcript_24132:585-1490(-)
MAQGECSFVAGSTRRQPAPIAPLHHALPGGGRAQGHQDQRPHLHRARRAEQRARAHVGGVAGGGGGLAHVPARAGVPGVRPLHARVGPHLQDDHRQRHELPQPVQERWAVHGRAQGQLQAERGVLPADAAHRGAHQRACLHQGGEPRADERDARAHAGQDARVPRLHAHAGHLTLPLCAAVAGQGGRALLPGRHLHLPCGRRLRVRHRQRPARRQPARGQGGRVPRAGARARRARGVPARGARLRAGLRVRGGARHAQRPRLAHVQRGAAARGRAGPPSWGRRRARQQRGPGAGGAYQDAV